MTSYILIVILMLKDLSFLAMEYLGVKVSAYPDYYYFFLCLALCVKPLDPLSWILQGNDLFLLSVSHPAIWPFTAS